MPPETSPPPAARHPEPTAATVALLAGMIERIGDGVTQKRYLLDGLARILDADAWSWTLTRTERPGDPTCMPVVILRLDGGLSDEQRTVLLATQRSPHTQIFAKALFAPVHQHGRATCRRQDVCADGEWESTGYYKEFVAAHGLAEFLLAIRRTGDTDVVTSAFYRRTGRPVFGADAATTLDLVIDHVPWLHQHGDIDSVARPLIMLTPRERQVLQLLVAGDARKQIAAKLGISEYTVGDYQKRIYRFYGVTSRGELQAKFLDGNARG